MEYITLPDLANATGVQYHTLWHRFQKFKSQIPYQRVGTIYLLDKEQAEKYLGETACELQKQ